MKTNYLAIDIGGTNIKYAVLNKSGNIISKDKIPTSCDDSQTFLDLLFNIIEPRINQIRGIAISVPGKVDTKTGTVYYGGSLPFLDGLKIREILEKRYKVITSLENDGKAAALAELWLGNLKGIENGLALVLGTGVGGGIIINNELYRGTNFQAGELSFIINSKTIESENYENLVGFQDSAVEMIKNINKSMGNKDIKDGISAFEAIKYNEVAQRIFKQFCRGIAQLIFNVQAVVDVQKIVIGGGISSQPLLVSEVTKQYEKILNGFYLFKNSLTPPKIVAAKFRNDANLYGALYALLQREDKSK